MIIIMSMTMRINKTIIIFIIFREIYLVCMLIIPFIVKRLLIILTLNHIRPYKYNVNVRSKYDKPTESSDNFKTNGQENDNTSPATIRWQDDEYTLEDTKYVLGIRGMLRPTDSYTPIVRRRIPSAMELKVEYEHLPESYKNVILFRNKDVTLIRSNISNMEDINEWVKIFQHKTNTQWIVRLSAPDKRRLVCGKRFVCQYSSYRKANVGKSKRCHLKNANCRAAIYLVVRLSTVHTKKKDEYVRLGLCGSIKINNIHSHDLFGEEIYKFLQPSDDVKNRFLEYFNSGMGVTEACSFHENLLKLNHGAIDILHNARKNPLQRTVRYWYKLWKTKAHRETGNTTEINEIVLSEMSKFISNSDEIKIDGSPSSNTTLNVSDLVHTSNSCDTKSKDLEILNKNDVAAALRHMNDSQRIMAEKIIVKILRRGLSNDLKNLDSLCNVNED